MNPIDRFTGFEKEINKAEQDAIALAKENECVAIIDDGIAREIGEMLNVDVHGNILSDISGSTAWFFE